MPSCSQLLALHQAVVLVAITPSWLAVLERSLTRSRPSGLVIGGRADMIGVAVLLAPVQSFVDGPFRTTLAHPEWQAILEGIG
jgi:hypothetical protein